MVQYDEMFLSVSDPQLVGSRSTEAVDVECNHRLMCSAKKKSPPVLSSALAHTPGGIAVQVQREQEVCAAAMGPSCSDC